MKIDIGESLVNSYLRHVKGCCIVQQNWKPSGNWIMREQQLELAHREFERIQKHKAFTEIFKTGFEATVRQTEIDVLGYTHDRTIYSANVTFHEYGINFGSRTDTRNRVIKNLLRAYLAMICYFPGYRHVFLYCSPKVTGATEDVLQEYFRILQEDFSSEHVSFRYLSNDLFRDQVMMQTLDMAQDQFDTSELFLRSFKLLTVYAGDLSEGEEPRENDGTRQEPADEVTSASSRKKKTVKTASDPAAREKDPAGKRPDTPVVAKEDDQTDDSGDEGEEDDETGTPSGLPVSDGELERKEIAKVKSRIPKWFKRPAQNNSKILIRFMEIHEKDENVTLRQLSDACPDVKNFPVNFSQMNKANGRNHGKVFTIEGNNVLLWEPVKDFIIREYIEFKKSYYQGE